jgi:hypothetical protein
VPKLQGCGSTSTSPASSRRHSLGRLLASPPPTPAAATSGTSLEQRQNSIGIEAAPSREDVAVAMPMLMGSEEASGQACQQPDGSSWDYGPPLFVGGSIFFANGFHHFRFLVMNLQARFGWPKCASPHIDRGLTARLSCGVFFWNSSSLEVLQPSFVRRPFLVDRLVQLASVTFGEFARVSLPRRGHVGLRRAGRQMVDGRFVSDVLTNLGDVLSLLHGNLLRKVTCRAVLPIIPRNKTASQIVTLPSSSPPMAV